jgi:hypothetical protein
MFSIVTQFWELPPYPNTKSCERRFAAAYSSDAQDVIVNEGKLYKEDVSGIEILVPLATPTTELVDAPQIAEAESYTCVISQGAECVEWSSFTTE